MPSIPVLTNDSFRVLTVTGKVPGGIFFRRAKHCRGRAAGNSPPACKIAMRKLRLDNHTRGFVSV